MKNEVKAPVYIDLFAGCGGLSLGLFNAGWRGLFAIEKNPDAFQTLKHNLIDNYDHFDWPSWLPQQHHDINAVIKDHENKLKKLQGKIDLVVGGPPCQGFSTAGLRREKDQRNRLIKSYLRFISLVRPNYIFFENVKGFTLEFKKNKLKGLAYSEYVTRVLRTLGYEVEGRLIDFSNYGIPQKRTRFILVGINNRITGDSKITAQSFFELLEKNKFNFLAKKNLSTSVSLEDAISDLLKKNGFKTSSDSKNFDAGFYAPATSNYQILMRKNIDNKTIVPDSHRFANHSDSIISKFKNVIRHHGDLSKLDSALKTKKRIQKLLRKDEAAPTLTTLPDDYIHYSEPRILTVREYARVQSFPDSFQFKGSYTTGGKARTSAVPRYSQIGNAIPPLFGEQSGRIFLELLRK